MRRLRGDQDFDPFLDWEVVFFLLWQDPNAVMAGAADAGMKVKPHHQEQLTILHNSLMELNDTKTGNFINFARSEAEPTTKALEKKLADEPDLGAVPCLTFLRKVEYFSFTERPGVSQGVLCFDRIEP